MIQHDSNSGLPGESPALITTGHGCSL